MMEVFYEILSEIGYTHPAHPPFTHVTIGLVVGAFFFCMAAIFGRRQDLTTTAHHCLILALLVLLPTILIGYMDWQHFYAGAWIPPIKMKIILASILLALLLIILLSAKTKAGAHLIRALSSLCLLLVLGIGYFGGELVYGRRTPQASTEGPVLAAAAEQFTQVCGGCHPNGGNALKPHLPLRKAPQLEDFDTFLSYVRNPEARDGSQTMMPPFAAETLSDEKMEALYEYIVRALKQD